jgi:hypothetical protein
MAHHITKRMAGSPGIGARCVSGGLPAPAGECRLLTRTALMPGLSIPFTPEVFQSVQYSLFASLPGPSLQG